MPKYFKGQFDNYPVKSCDSQEKTTMENNQTVLNLADFLVGLRNADKLEDLPEEIRNLTIVIEGDHLTGSID